MKELIELYMMLKENQMFVNQFEEENYRYLIYLYIQEEKERLGTEIW